VALDLAAAVPMFIVGAACCFNSRFYQSDSPEEKEVPLHWG
jgi:hypothetical protein